MWSVIFDVTTAIVLGHHNLDPYKVVNLIDQCCVCSDCSTAGHSPISLPLLLRHSNIEIRPVNDPTIASMC